MSSHQMDDYYAREEMLSRLANIEELLRRVLAALTKKGAAP
jgi:hypothetical protein